jgi:uncharacterized repeat protein (TIGR04076 family)
MVKHIKEISSRKEAPMFKVKAVVVDFIGDKERYPCHHGYQLGDEFTFDGASFAGSICPSLALTVVPRMMEVHAAGSRYKDYIHYYPFLYAPLSTEAPELKKYDGLGYRNVLETITEPPFHVANLAGSGAFKWPPPEHPVEHRDIKLVCPDYRTSVVVKIEAYDVSDAGRNIPFFRREMSILDKVLKKPGIKMEDIMGEFSPEQIEVIYPALSQAIVESLLDELQLTGYLEIRDGRVTAGKKAAVKLNEFKAGLSAEEREALKL